MYDKAIDSMLEMHRLHVHAREASDERAHELHMHYASALTDTVRAQGRAIEQFAAPVGPSVDIATILPTGSTPALLTTEDANEIRDSQKLEWESISDLTLTTDGFKFHTNGLSVENPAGDGFLMARVTDPKFSEESNPYTNAAQRRSSIEVLARKGYKGGALSAIEIVEFKREIVTRSPQTRQD